MSGFRRLQERLREEGWYVGWNEPCCQSCAWGCLPYEHVEGPHKGEEVDFDKVLFNHSQDCEVYHDYVDCEACDGEGWLDEDNECSECEGEGATQEFEDDDISQYDHQHDGFVCYHPEQTNSSMFCFSGDKKGVKNLKAILPIIEECGCEWHWDQTGKTRIEISWNA
jgi:RecJ-like exonuclease